jgi:alkanesulfonate monooxygenase SsuD/methylene tetrahydromethanopterin reductase-like flavin-dependent oxidoreductase (luciferase family)
MRLGVSLAQTGRLADPASVRSAATAAEQVGYASVWVHDRLDGGRAGDASLDPLCALSYAAAVTSRVRLGTSVLVAPWYRPALLARSLASLDVLSDGRLTIGLGLDATPAELAAVGVDDAELGRRLDDALDVIGRTWDPGHDGPAGRPRPPILLAASTPEGLDRVARRADGWNPAGLPIEQLGPLWARVRDLAARHGRDPDALELVVRADLRITDQPLEGDRPAYAGTVEQVAADVADTGRAGAHETILCLQGDHGLDTALDVYARIAEAVDVTPPPLQAGADPALPAGLPARRERRLAPR